MLLIGLRAAIALPVASLTATTACSQRPVHARGDRRKSTRTSESSAQNVDSLTSRNAGGHAPRRVDARTSSDDDNGIVFENLRVHCKKNSPPRMRRIGTFAEYFKAMQFAEALRSIDVTNKERRGCAISRSDFGFTSDK
ncbi:hypothetical protein [Burkholderia stagnalis]